MLKVKDIIAAANGDLEKEVQFWSYETGLCDAKVVPITIATTEDGKFQEVTNNEEYQGPKHLRPRLRNDYRDILLIDMADEP